MNMDRKISKLFLILCLSASVINCNTASSVPPSDCSYETSRHLTCHLSSINSRLEKTDFSVVPNNTLSLTVICTQAGVVGQMEPAGFAGLTHLHHLNLQGCNLQTIPSRAFAGLRHLKTLSVTGTGSGGSDEPLRIEAGALDHLTSLEALNLSNNGLRELPAEQLCRLDNLGLLNVSHNEIGSAFDLGIEAVRRRRSCLSRLHSLDLSHNQLTSLEAGTVFGLAQLEQLDLSHNYIRFVSGGVFGASLHTLGLDNNQISHLPANLFQSVPLRQLGLANNSLSSLPSGLLRGQFGLESLDLAGNILMTDSLSANLTADLVNLQRLDLCRNHLASLPHGFVQPLVNLQSLWLCSNKLAQISFPGPLVNLASLDLSNNQLRAVEPHYFSGLAALTQLSLSGNQLSTVHPAAFANNSGLLILDLSRNNMAALPAGLQNLTSLQTVDLSANRITHLESAVVERLSSLWRLQIHDNLMADIPEAFFGPLTSLQVLDMSNNRLERLRPSALDANPGLRAIRLDGNRLREMDGVFAQLPSLTWLNMSNNQLEAFDYSLVPRTLHWLDISHNQVSDLGNYFNMENSSLTYLDASFNQLVKISATNLPINLETVLLNDNAIEDISQYAFFDKQALTKVDLSVNKLTGFGKSTLLLSPVNTRATTFSLGGNPIVCDCEMTWFKTINAGETLDNYPLISDLESIYCRLVYTEEQAFIPLVEARNDQFLCSYSTHCFSLCQCCQFDSCDCEMTCPEGCSCYHDNTWTKNIIQCSALQSSSIPDNIPMDATELYLDGNNYATLRSHTFIGRKNLRSLHLNNSNIEKIENHTFNGLKSLTSLHLENNNLATLAGQEFSTLSNLRELYLQGNQINHIDNATFKGLRSLEVLFLQGNSIIDFPVWELAFNPYLVSIRLAENLWSCDCDYLHMFRTWLQVSGPKAADADQISCVSNTPEQENVLVTNAAASTCELIHAVAVGNQRQEEQTAAAVASYMPLMIALLASLCIVIIFTFVVFGFRHSIKMWVSSANKSSSERMIESPSPSTSTSSSSTTTDDGKLFDAYVSYSPRDTLFVNQVLCRELENSSSADTQYRICLHHRDLPAAASNGGGGIVTDSVSRVSDASKRIIVVLSQNFLQTEWSRYDLKAGLLQSVSGGHKRLIFLVAGVIDLNLVDPTLRMLLKSAEVVSMSDPALMAKLEFSVPAGERDSQHYYSTCKFPSVYMEPDMKQQPITGGFNHISHI